MLVAHGSHRAKPPLPRDNPNRSTMMVTLRKRPVLLMIRDGWGHNPNPEMHDYNAIELARTPVNDRLLAEYPNTQIQTSGEAVGLPAGTMGNSEVGHQNIGAGRIVDQEVMRITRAIRDGSFFKLPVLRGAFEHAAKNGGSVHVMGLMSDGLVHSDMTHAFAIVDLCKTMGFDGKRFFIHALMDGRDTPPESGAEFLRQMDAKLAEAGVGRIGSVIGRFYAMDRDNRWDRVQKAYAALTQGAARIAANAPQAALDYYANPTASNMTGDEFIFPTSIAPTGTIEEAQKIKAGDAVIFFNYRGDRTREITKAFTYDDAAWAAIAGGGFERGGKIADLFFAGMTGYEKGLPMEVIFAKPPKMVNILGDVIAKAGLKQFRTAETEKFAHVTFFFNDYREEPFPGEERQLIPSPKDIDTYDKKPQMAAYGVTDALIPRIESGEFDLIAMNYANCDMVGHTGVLAAAIKAAEAVDECLGRVVTAVLAQGGALVITADHGNAEQEFDPSTGGAFTAHTIFPVDLIVVDDSLKGCKLVEGGALCDIAPTVLDLLGLPKPAEMTGTSLIPAECLK